MIFTVFALSRLLLPQPDPVWSEVRSVAFSTSCPKGNKKYAFCKCSVSLSLRPTLQLNKWQLQASCLSSCLTAIMDNSDYSPTSASVICFRASVLHVKTEYQRGLNREGLYNYHAARIVLRPNIKGWENTISFTMIIYECCIVILKEVLYCGVINTILCSFPDEANTITEWNSKIS